MVQKCMVMIEGTKQKEETYGKIVAAWDDAKTGQTITIVQPNDMGGRSLEKTLMALFPDATSDSRNKARYITLTKSDYIHEKTKEILIEWRRYNELTFVDTIGFYSMPGIFGWDKVDKGSMILCDHLDKLKGIVADFGCGYGYLSHFSLAKFEEIEQLYAIDIDPKAVAATRKNIVNSRAKIIEGDCTKIIPDLPQCDVIIMNPPFHNGSSEDKKLGQDFIKTASHHLKKSGVLFMVANAHLPYEKILKSEFPILEKLFEGHGFKIFKTSFVPVTK